MTIILRLQGLDVKAGAADIRKFFQCLHIPDGGVYIVGGSLREAFIAFTAERDAQLAMRLTGNVLKGSRVTLHVSSLAELEHKLELMMMKKMKKQQTSPTQMSVRGPQTPPDGNLPSLNASPREHNAVRSPTSASWPLDPNAATLPQPLYSNESNLQPAAVNSLDSNTAFLLGVCTVLQGLQARQGENDNLTVDIPEVVDGVVAATDVATTLSTVTSQPGYIRLFGLPASTTKTDICHFFRGLAVEEAIVNVKLGLSHVCLVKFTNAQDACDALRFNKQSLGAICVEVRGASEKMWMSALQECENASDDVMMRAKPQQNDPERKHQPAAPPMKRKHADRFLDQPPKKQMSVGDAAAAVERVVVVRNLPKDMTKTEIKELFVCPNISHKNVLHLLDGHGQRTDTAFLIFNRDEDYDYAMNLTGCPVGPSVIQVSSITKEKMKDMMAKTHPRNQRRSLKKHHKKKLDLNTETASDIVDTSAQTFLFVRNMPADVKKFQIKSFFCKYKLRDDDILLLLDGNGSSVGEAIVRFKSQTLAAAAALKLHGRNFLGAQLLLTCITAKQADDILTRSV